MIGHLQGQVAWKKPPWLLLTVGGVGYELEAPMPVFYELPAVGGEVSLHTHLVVREDARLLYGFSTLVQRDLFRLLLKVSGVGPRVALAILSGMSPPEFRACVIAADDARLTRVPGIGTKTAKRLLMEMRDRIGTDGGDDPIMPEAPDAVRDAISALITLGYKQVDATRAVRAVRSDGLSSEELIRAALRAAGGGGA